MLHNFKSRPIALINKDREYFQYNPGEYLISLLTTQLRTNSRKVSIKYVGPLVIYKIVDPHNYLLMTIDGQLMRGLFEHERLKPAVIRPDKGNVDTLSMLKKVINLEIPPPTINQLLYVSGPITHSNKYKTKSNTPHKLTIIYMFQGQKTHTNYYLYVSGPKTAY